MTNIRKNRGKKSSEEIGGKLLDFPQKKLNPEALTQLCDKTILVADDEPHMIRLLRLNLEPEGYKVLEAQDGDEAYSLAHQNKPDIVLLDIVFPKVNGIEICRALKDNRDTAHIPIILITAGGEGMRKAGLESGADLFLTKPFSPLRLLAEIRRMVEKRNVD